MFTFRTAAAITFGIGASRELPALTAGKRVFLVSGSNPARYPVLAELSPVGTYTLASEPTFDDAREAVLACRDAKAEMVVALGGGAVVDLGKAVAVLAAHEGDPLDYAEIIGKGKPLGSAKLSMIAVPTTAGTGSEVTANAVLASPEHRLKVSLRGPRMLPEHALVDPELTITCPASVTAYSGMDALTQCLEPYTSHAANPLTDGFAAEGLRRARTALTRAFTTPDDLDARSDMALCSLMGGLSLANAKLGAVHGLAGVLGGVTGAPHGAICAALLAPVTMANLTAMFDRESANPAIERYRQAAQILTGEPHTSALQGWLLELTRHLELPGLAALGLTADQHEHVVASAQNASSMKGNPIVLSSAELHTIVDAAL